MDFHSLPRRDLQTLCKKNQIHANQTNIAMADALASLLNVEGLDEFLNPPKHDATQSPGKEKPPTPVIMRSMARASTRRSIALEPETEHLPSRTTTRRSMRNRNAAAADKECKVLNFAETPVVPRTTKRADSVSAQLNEEMEQVEDEKNEEVNVVADRTVNTAEKTRQGKTRASVTQSMRMSTRRSTRLLEKKMNDWKLSNEVTMDLEPIKMSDLAAEKDFTEDSEDVVKDKHPSESVEEDPKAENVAYEVEALVEVGSEIETEEKSESGEISEKSETKAAESEVDAAPVEVETESNLPDSQLIANAQSRKSNEFIKEAEEENEIYCYSENVANEVDALVEVVSEIEGETGSPSTEIYGKKETTAAKSDVDEPVEDENDSKTRDFWVIVNIQDEKIDEVDESLVGQLQEGLTLVEEAADGHGQVELTVNVAPADGDDISELTAQVNSLNLDCLKEDSNKDMDDEEAGITPVPDVTACFVEDHNDVVFDGYLADTDAVSESTVKVHSLNDDGELDVRGAALPELPNNPLSNSAVKMELFDNIGQLFDVDVTEAEELAMERPRIQKSVETVDVQIIIEETFEAVIDSNIAGADDSKVLQGGDNIFSKNTPASIKKTNRVPLSPLSVGLLTEVPTALKSSNKKMQLKDGNKENVGGAAEVGKKKITELLVVADEDNQKPTPLQNKSMGQLKKMLKEKTKLHNEKRLALQVLPENKNKAASVEKNY